MKPMVSPPPSTETSPAERAPRSSDAVYRPLGFGLRANTVPSWHLAGNGFRQGS